MKIAWVLLISLVIVLMLQESDAWRRRRRRGWGVRIRTPRVRVRRLVRIPRVRVRRFVRIPRVRIGRLIRKPRIRIRRFVRRIGVRKFVRLPRVRLGRFIRKPRIRVRRFARRVRRTFRKIGRFVKKVAKNVVKKVAKNVIKKIILTNPKLLIPKKLYDKYKKFRKLVRKPRLRRLRFRRLVRKPRLGRWRFGRLLRKPRVRVRFRRFVRKPRVRLPFRRLVRIPRVRWRFRRLVRKPRFRVRRLVRRVGKAFQKIGHVLGKTVNIVANGVILANPKLYVAQTLLDTYIKYKIKKEQIRIYNKQNPQDQQAEPKDEQVLCGGLLEDNSCKWYCGEISELMDSGQLKWPGDAIAVSCDFGDYDNGYGYFEPADLAYQLFIRPNDDGNLQVFKKLDKNCDGKVSKIEFDNEKKILLSKQGQCSG